MLKVAALAAGNVDNHKRSCRAGQPDLPGLLWLCGMMAFSVFVGRLFFIDKKRVVY